MPVRIQTEDFDLSQEIKQLRAGDARVGAVASFVGTVRDRNDGSEVAAMTLEHYPGMTEKSLEEIIEKAKARWDIFDVLIIHRVGPLNIEDQIVLTAVTSAHRSEALPLVNMSWTTLKPWRHSGKKKIPLKELAGWMHA